jgi:hypothetical protein
MTMAEVVFCEVFRIAIPPALQRRMAVEQSPAALPKGAVARGRTEDDQLTRRMHHPCVTAVAAVGEKDEIDGIAIFVNR